MIFFKISFRTGAKELDGMKHEDTFSNLQGKIIVGTNFLLP